MLTTRRNVLRLLAAAGGASVTSAASLRGERAELKDGWPDADASDASAYGVWLERYGAPAFEYDVDHESLPFAEWDPILAPPTRRNWVMLGNRALGMQAANDGTVAVFDERYGLRWLTAPDPRGTGVSLIHDIGEPWGTDYAQRGGERPSRRTFGTTWFEVRDRRAGLSICRTVLCPEGEVPWLLVRARLQLDRRSRARVVHHVERWALRPRFLQLFASDAQRRDLAERSIVYDVAVTSRGLVAREVFEPRPEDARTLFGPPAELVLECLGETRGTASDRYEDSPHPVLEIESRVELEPGAPQDLWFRFGHADADPVASPASVFRRSLRAVARRLPRAASLLAPQAHREVPWHAAKLTGALAVDRVIGGHTLDQGSAYAYASGFNGAARDPLQHALPLVYLDPERALAVLRNTCAWGTPDGPSDQNLWALWLASEYAAATGDLAAFDAPLPYHPIHGAPTVSLREHLRRQFRFFIDGVGRGERGHVRILNADWNDVAISESGVPRDVMISAGSSVLNSAMGSWVLARYAGLSDRLGDAATASWARSHAEDLRMLVASAWNGRWFDRAYAPGAAPVGRDDCWLEVQPWAILCGAADDTQARALLDVIGRGHRADSPLGARVRWPANPAGLADGTWGEALRGGIWYAINMTLVWAAAKVHRRFAWDEWRRMSLRAHTKAYPEIWEGTLSGPDAWNAPEATRPGRTWAAPPFVAMQAFPVSNAHSHAQPLLSYLRLLGVEPTPSGSLAVGFGASFRSPTFALRGSGHGRLRAKGPVVVETVHGTVSGGPGRVRW